MTKKKEAVEASPADRWANKILGTGFEDPNAILPNPHNWRTHSEQQRHALRGVLNQVGWVGSATVNKRTGRLVDGHLRVALAIEEGVTSVPVTYVDLSEQEEMLVLATLDPLSAMAGIDPDALRVVLDSVEVDDLAVKQILNELAEEAGIGAQAQNDDAETAGRTVKEISYKYELVFEDEDDLQVWYRFLRLIRERFPEHEVVSDRLVAYLKAEGFETADTGEPQKPADDEDER